MVCRSRQTDPRRLAALLFFTSDRGYHLGWCGQAEGKPGEFCSMPPGWGAGRTVRTQRWRLVERLDGSRELYDHNTDPAEYVNLIQNPEHEPLVQRLNAMLENEFGPLGTSQHKQITAY